jgi:CRP-like cAMP-binding protein
VDVDGYEVIHFIHGPGMTFGEPGYFAVERTRIVAAVAVAPTVLIRLDRRDLGPFMDRHPAVKDRALEGLASNTRWQSTMIASLVTRPLKDRLVLRLLELVDSNPERVAGKSVTPKISQSMLASMIGVSRENVNRALSALALGGVDPAGGRPLRARRRGAAPPGGVAGLAARGTPGPASERDRRVAQRTTSVPLRHTLAVIQRHSAGSSGL